MEPSKPSLDLLRHLSDQHVLTALIDEPRLTRAQIATRSGLSKPTVGESVRRLVESGVVRDTGGVTTGRRGRAGTLFALADDIGVALAVSIAPDGIRAEAVDVYGQVVATAVESLSRPASPDEVGRTLQRVVTEVGSASRPAVRLVVVSAADPVDRRSGRLVHLPDAPFLVGDLSPKEVLQGVVSAPVSIDNDVNWAARAERRATGDSLDDFAYLYLDEGLGCAVVSDGEVLRGARGLAGEVAHLLTRGAAGRAVPFTEVFAELGLRQEGSTAIEVEATVSAIAEAPGADDPSGTLGHLAGAIGGVLAAMIALLDPEEIILGGAVGSDPRLFAATEAAFRAMPRHVPLRRATIVDQPSLTGVRQDALARLRTWVSTGGGAPG
ncbi:ROK family transcriptional regulator [Phycicoccus avicenniae]|uniref:ROK family transcriptional regulator n=1 Tax=Phycicoccus avicenniae TaxID=2828860 RepID=UPI003D28A67D